MSLRDRLMGRRATGGGRDAACAEVPSTADRCAQTSAAKRGDKRSAANQQAQARAARRAEVAEQARAVRETVRAQAVALEAAPSKQTPGRFTHLYSSRDDAMSVFADAAGHVVAVGTARLA